MDATTTVLLLLLVWGSLNTRTALTANNSAVQGHAGPDKGYVAVWQWEQWPQLRLSGNSTRGPGPRSGSSLWFDRTAAGWWLFGGRQTLSPGGAAKPKVYSDLWRYDSDSRAWSRVFPSDSRKSNVGAILLLRTSLLSDGAPRRPGGVGAGVTADGVVLCGRSEGKLPQERSLAFYGARSQRSNTVWQLELRDKLWTAYVCCCDSADRRVANASDTTEENTGTVKTHTNTSALYRTANATGTLRTHVVEPANITVVPRSRTATNTELYETARGTPGLESSTGYRATNATSGHTEPITRPSHTTGPNTGSIPTRAMATNPNVHTTGANTEQITQTAGTEPHSSHNATGTEASSSYTTDSARTQVEPNDAATHPETTTDESERTEASSTGRETHPEPTTSVDGNATLARPSMAPHKSVHLKPSENKIKDRKTTAAEDEMLCCGEGDAYGQGKASEPSQVFCPDFDNGSGSGASPSRPAQPVAWCDTHRELLVALDLRASPLVLWQFDLKTSHWTQHKVSVENGTLWPGCARNTTSVRYASAGAAVYILCVPYGSSLPTSTRLVYRLDASNLTLHALGQLQLGADFEAPDGAALWADETRSVLQAVDAGNNQTLLLLAYGRLLDIWMLDAASSRRSFVAVENIWQGSALKWFSEFKSPLYHLQVAGRSWLMPNPRPVEHYWPSERGRFIVRLLVQEPSTTGVMHETPVRPQKLHVLASGSRGGPASEPQHHPAQDGVKALLFFAFSLSIFGAFGVALFVRRCVTCPPRRAWCVRHEEGSKPAPPVIRYSVIPDDLAYPVA